MSDDLDRLIQGYVDGSLDASERNELEAALRRDPQIADRLQEYRWIHSALGEGTDVPQAASPDLPGRVVRDLEGRQAERLREMTLGAIAGRSRSARRRRGREVPPGFGPWLIAAGILVGFVALLLFSSSGTSVRPPEAPTAPVVRKTPAPPHPSIRPIEKRPSVKVAPQTPPVPSREQGGVPALPAPREPKVAPAPSPKPRTPEPVPPSPRPATTVATVVALEKISGSGLVLLGGPLRELREGDFLRVGEGLRLPADASVTLRYTDGTWVRLAGETVVENARNAGGKRLMLRAGSLEADVAPQPAREPMVVETPHAEARVVGTRLTLAVQNGRTRLDVTEGRVRLRRGRDGKSVFVTAGHYAIAGPETALVARPIEAVVTTFWVPAVDRGARVSAPMTIDRMPPAGSLSGRPLFAAMDNRSLPGTVRMSERSLRPDRDEGGWVEYAVDLPEDGEWFLWARLYAPGEGVLWRRADGTGDDPNSFYVRIDGKAEQILGNLRQDTAAGRSYYRRWHWGGDGRRQDGTPTALPLGTLKAGKHVIRIRNRDAVETASLRLSPRLDVVCLTRDPRYVPRDEDVRLKR